jgi:hypothetical protein
MVVDDLSRAERDGVPSLFSLDLTQTCFRGRYRPMQVSEDFAIVIDLSSNLILPRWGTASSSEFVGAN